jgi:hypothetical protein
MGSRYEHLKLSGGVNAGLPLPDGKSKLVAAKTLTKPDGILRISDKQRGWLALVLSFAIAAQASDNDPPSYVTRSQE